MPAIGYNRASLVCQLRQAAQVAVFFQCLQLLLHIFYCIHNSFKMCQCGFNVLMCQCANMPMTCGVIAQRKHCAANWHISILAHSYNFHQPSRQLPQLFRLYNERRHQVYQSSERAYPDSLLNEAFCIHAMSTGFLSQSPRWLPAHVHPSLAVIGVPVQALLAVAG